MNMSVEYISKSYCNVFKVPFTQFKIVYMDNSLYIAVERFSNIIFLEFVSNFHFENVQ